MLDQWGYFLKEAGRSLRQQWSTHLVSWLCIAFSLVLLAGALTGWMQLEHVVEAVRAEADISLFVDDELTGRELDRLLEQVREYPGVRGAVLVSENEALERMSVLLGGQRQLLTAFEEVNPFSRFIEVSVVPEAAPGITRAGADLPGVWGVRANEEVLTGLINLTLVVRWVGIALASLVALITIVLISHIIKLGIGLRQKEIGVLRLLGASDAFIAIPFYLEGVIIGLLGGVLAALMTGMGLGALASFLQRGLPFLPLVDTNELLRQLAAVLLLFGVGAGIIGSFFGLRQSPY